MKNKISALLLSFVLCLGLLGTAFAAAGSTTVNTAPSTAPGAQESGYLQIKDSDGVVQDIIKVENGAISADDQAYINDLAGNGAVTIVGTNGSVVVDKNYVDPGNGDDDPGEDDRPSSGGRPVYWPDTGSASGYTVRVPSTANGSVTVSPIGADQGMTVTITATPLDGYKIASVTVTDANGNTVATQSLGDGRYTFTMPAAEVTVRVKFEKAEEEKPAQPTQPAQPAVPATPTFSDVKSSDWYASAVAYVAQRGIMNGTGDGKFSPMSTTTRGMIMTMLARMNGVNTDGGSVWYEKGMLWAVGQGISDGTNPEGVVTREQLVTMLYRYMDSPAATGDFSGYPDAAAVSDWAVNGMKWAVANGLISGTNTGALNPGGTATRAEVATIMMRFCEKFAV